MPALIAALAARPASAQFRIDSWTTEHGLPQNTITDITQTSDGFLWLSTFGGLVRFDGTAFEVFNTVNAPGMQSSRLTNVFEAAGALWATTEAQGIVRHADGVFTTYTTANGLPGDVVGHAFVRDGSLIVGAAGRHARWTGTAFEPYIDPAALDETHGRRAIVLQTRQGIMWTSDAAGMYRVERGRVTRTLPPMNPRRLFEERSGRVWLETQARTLASVTSGTVRHYGAPDGVPRFSTASFIEDADGTLWFGIRASGILRYDGRRFSRFTTQDGLPSDNVNRIFQDREGTHWIATDGGLARLTTRVMTTHAAAEGLAADNTYAVLEQRNGDVWIGGWPGLTRVRRGVIEDVSREFQLRENIMALAEDRDGALWVGTWGSGIRRIADGRADTYQHPDAPGSVVRAIHQARDGTIWAGGVSGLSRLRGNRFEAVGAEDGFPPADVLTIFESRDGTLWIGTARGLSRLRHGAFTHYAEADGLAGKPVRSIHEDASGSLWLGTYDSGLFRFRDGRFARLTTRQGLFTNGAFRIIEDERGSFWISSNTGIYRVSRADLDAVAEGRLAEVTSVPYGRRDGMLLAECNGGSQPAGIRARDGRIWFPTQKGVVVFDPRGVPVDANPPPVALTRMLVGDDVVPISSRIEMRDGSRAIEVGFAALTYIRPELSRYRYRMGGLHEQWTDPGANRSARYAQLPYGVFDFQVIAANRDGVWNRTGARVRIVVVPPWWRTVWFGGVGLAMFAAIGWSVHRARIAHLRRQRDLREAFSRQLIDSQEADRRRIAAGLHDGLSQNLIVIRNWALLGRQGVPAGSPMLERLDDIETAATDGLAEVRQVVNDLAPHNLERLGLAQTIQEMVDRVGESSSLACRARVVDVGGRLPTAAQIALYRVLQEALNNLVKHSRATGAWLDMDDEGDVLRVTLRDNGCGFDAGTQDRADGPRGFGLLGMAERVRMSGGRFTMDAAVGRGTRIVIEMPLKREAG